MKLSKLFHTLYATVMALPVLIIPIFALNILHKETEPISIEVQEKVSLDFNQLSTEQNFSGTRADTNSRFEKAIQVWNNNSYVGMMNYSYVLSTGLNQLRVKNSFNGNKVIQKHNGTSQDIIFNTALFDVQINHIYLFNNTFTNIQVNVENSFHVENMEIFDLTQMYGVGNEPTIEEFNALFPNAYYSYTESQKMLVNKPSPTTYNSTDIGSQFVYALYKPVNDYFNFGDFFGLGGMYDWFQLNIFNGTAPLSFFIVFNVMIYWLFISLFWLLFDILIYVPMIIHKWLDKAEM